MEWNGIVYYHNCELVRKFQFVDYITLIITTILASDTMKQNIVLQLIDVPILLVQQLE